VALSPSDPPAHTELVLHHRKRYFAASDPIGRRVILEEIVDVIVSQPGRFVRQDKKSGEWLSISRSDATTKTARAMQYQARHVVKAAATEIAMRACSHERQVVDSPSVSTFKDDNHMAPLAEYTTLQGSQDAFMPSPGWVPHSHGSMWELGSSLEHYYYYRGWLTMNHASHSGPACRRVSEMRKKEWPQRFMLRPELYVPLLHHGYHLTPLHDSQMFYPDARSLTQIQASNVPLVTSPCSPKEHCRLDLPLRHDLSGLVGDKVRSDGDDEHWCATSLGSFDSEDELEQLDRDMKW
jgi:hypothetical protein